MNKYIHAAFLLFMCNILLPAQTIIVKDKVTLSPIESVVIQFSDGRSAVTDKSGFSLLSSLTDHDTLTFRHPAYIEQKMVWSTVVKNKFTILLNERVVQLSEVVFSANKTAENKSDVPYAIEVINAKRVAFDNPQTSADMLQNSGTVFVQKSQMGAGSPILRGFESSKVLLVVDGVRMNNAIYRSGHLQDVITIDNAMLDRTEVLFGPSSVVYGSDALGGTMHFYTRDPLLSDSTNMNFRSGAYVRHATANQEKTGHLDLNIGFKKVGFLTSVTYSDFSDLRTGNDKSAYNPNFGKAINYVERINGKDSMFVNADPNIQKFSGYKQLDLMEKILIKFNDKISQTFNIQYSTSSDVPRYDRLQEYSGSKLKYAEWKYGPQNRLFATAKTSLTHISPLFDDANIILAYQTITQDRITRRFNNNSREGQYEKVNVYSFNLDAKKQLKEQHELRYGLEASFNDVRSSANATNIVTGVVSSFKTRYPDGGSTMSSAAAYITHSWEINKKVILSDGVRYNFVSLHSVFNDKTFFPFPFNSIDQKHNAITGNLGLVILPANGWRFSVLGSSGFRAPNVDDMTKVFESVGGLLIVPNPDIKPEYAYNGEVGVSKTFNESVKVEVVYFHTLLQNAIVVNDYKFNGADSVDYKGVKSKVQASQNVDRAYIQGVSASFSADFNQNFGLKSVINYTYGRYTDVKKDSVLPMDHIPPVFGQTSLYFKSKKVEAEVYVRYNGWKLLKDYNRSAISEDNLSQATAVGMPSWYTLNVKASYKINKYVGVNIGLENMLDQHYRLYASGISAPGRNLIVSLRANF